MKRELTKILGLTGVLVKDKKSFENTLILEVKLQSKAARCPNCCQISHRLHQNHYFLVKDIPWGREVSSRLGRKRNYFKSKSTTV